MDLQLIRKLIKISLKLNLPKLHKKKPLYKGGEFKYHHTKRYKLQIHLTWDQVIEKKYRAGFELWQKVVVKSGHFAGFTGYVAGFHPNPDYILILVQSEPRLLMPRFGFKDFELEAQVDGKVNNPRLYQYK